MEADKRPRALRPRGLLAFAALVVLLLGVARQSVAAEDEPLVKSLRAVKPAVVALGSYARVSKTGMQIFGTAFAVSSKGHLVTAAHVVEAIRAKGIGGTILAFPQAKSQRNGLVAEVVVEDAVHDVAVLKVSGCHLPAARLGQWQKVEEGQGVAICGFPYGMVFGPYPTCQSGIVSNISPVALPARRRSDLTAERIKALRNPFPIFQLDCVAYPGDSGGPLFLQRTGEVVGVVSSAFVRARKEGDSLIRVHTGISYAIPIAHVKRLLSKCKVELK